MKQVNNTFAQIPEVFRETGSAPASPPDLLSTMSMRGRPSSGSGAANPRLSNSLHRCAIALCSNQAVAEGVCSMHLSRNGRVSGGGQGAVMDSRVMGSRGMPPASGGMDDAMADDRYYRASAHAAMQPRGAPATKKHKSSPAEPVNRYVMDNSASSGGLTRESLNEMVNQMQYSKNTGMSAYENDPYVAAQASASTNGSNRSESDGSVDETNLRRERNRIAARKSRQRKLDRISNLEDEKMRLEQHRDMLVQEIRSLEKKDSGVASNVVLTITDKEYQQLQNKRLQIIKHVEEAYNSGDILSTVKFFRDDSIVSGPQNSSVHLRGKDALVLDYLCTTYLFGDVRLHHAKVDCGGPRSQHFRVHWALSGTIKSAGVSMNKEFLELIESVKGRRVTIEGVSNFSFSGDKIVYVHRTADQAKFLSALVNLSKR
ncbi:Alcohol dehydrogenase 3 [Phytophthora cinnamomi]|uniref:Alcohol dehydrogenase 3 n=1 Tax=Phytophthora cinnamomi TaxID=4785 RepID=UPI00355A272C|nr:Alcohol dehydrogenase 3 [Phytophthora cinnamomi]